MTKNRLTEGEDPNRLTRAHPETSDLPTWFGQGHYRDQTGQPRTFYHGSKEKFAKFKANLTPDDHVPGVTITPVREEAAMYGEPREVMTRVRNPISYGELERFAARRAGKVGDPDFAAFDVKPHTLAKWLKEAGHDAIDYTGDPGLGYGIRVLDPNDVRWK